MNLSNEPYIISRGYTVKDIDFTCDFCETKFSVRPIYCGTEPITELDEPYNTILVIYKHRCPICGVECRREISKEDLKLQKLWQ